MLTKKRLALLIYWINAAIMLVIGGAFVTAETFFPFHGDVIGLRWEHLTENSQTLYLGMMRTEGAGYLATATAMAFLLVFPIRRDASSWPIYAITSVALVEHFPTLLATYHVAQTTPASPPWVMTLVCMLSMIFAASLSIISQEKRA